MDIPCDALCCRDAEQDVDENCDYLTISIPLSPAASSNTEEFPIFKSPSYPVAALSSNITKVASWTSRVDLCTTTPANRSISMNKRISFPKPDLLRSIPASVVLRLAGSILSGSAGSKATYGFSNVVQAIDVFISHNWSTPRPVKFLTLALYFNLNAALLVTVITSVALAALTTQDLLPLYEVEGIIVGDYDSDVIIIRRGLYCTVCGTLAFALAFFFAHESPQCSVCPSPTVFLDKICINQVNDEAKQEGIECLAAFIRYSRKMLVVYSDTYLQRLWTIYELASFMVLHRSVNMIVIPTFLPKLVLVGCFVWTGFTIALELISFAPATNSQLMFYVVTLGIGFPPVVALSALLRSWVRRQARIYAHVQDFSILDATCFDESDRPIVQRSIVTFMLCIGRVTSKATEKEALSEFDALVKAEVPPALLASFGRVGLPYRHVMTMGLGFSLCYADLCCGWILSGFTIRYTVTGALLGAMMQFTVLPLGVAAASYLARFALDRQGVAEGFVVGTSGLAIYVLVAGLFYILQQLRAVAESSDAAHALYLITSMLLILLTYIIYRPPAGRPTPAFGMHRSYDPSNPNSSSMTSADSASELPEVDAVDTANSVAVIECARVPPTATHLFKETSL